jgi:hypothetical protein
MPDRHIRIYDQDYNPAMRIRDALVNTRSPIYDRESVPLRSRRIPDQRPTSDPRLDLI